MSLKRRGSHVMDGVYTRIDIRQILATSNMDGMLKNWSAYGVLSPEDVEVVKN
ncbi:hypothetical protein YC2023_086412 [Brassica napus]